MDGVDFSDWIIKFDDALVCVLEEAIEAGPEEAQKAASALKWMNMGTISINLWRIQSRAEALALEVPVDSVQ